jgi:hypothetical protein
MEQDKRSQIKKYFKKFPKWAVWMIIIGLPFLAAYGVGAIAIAIGVWGLVTHYQKPTDEQMDAWIQEDLKSLQARALEKTGLDQSELIGEPVMVYGPRFWNIGGAEAGIKKGKDGVVRFMPLGVTLINFTPHQLVAYQCALDLTTGKTLSESTDEYFYRDVVSVSTQSKTMTWDQAALGESALSGGPLAALVTAGKLQFNDAQTFTLTTSGGTSIEVVLRDPKLIESVGGGRIPTDVAEKAAQTIRKMLREKKAAAASA